MRASRGGLALRRIGGGRLCGGGSICSCRSRGGVLGKRTWRSRRIDNPSFGAAGGFRRNGGKRCFLALGGGRFFTRLCGRRRWFCRQGGCARRSRRSCDRQDCDCRGGHCRRPVVSQRHIRQALASRNRGRGRACRARGVRRRARCRRRRGPSAASSIPAASSTSNANPAQVTPAEGVLIESNVPQKAVSTGDAR